MRLDEIIGLLDAMAEALVERRGEEFELGQPDQASMAALGMGLGGLLFVETDGTDLDPDPGLELDEWELPY
jgi:hypothetical protein